MKIENSTEMTVMEVPKTAPNDAVMKIMDTNDRMMACPAMMFANRRTVKAKGFVKIPNISMTGMNGTGTFSQVGTSGQNISFQYSLVPNMFTAKKVINAKN